VGADPSSDLVSEIARLTRSIDRAAAATEIALAGAPAAPDDDPRPPVAEYKELSRQLSALRERVALAGRRNEGPRALRAELATLLFFARTLQSDTDSWRSGREQQHREFKRQTATARTERESVAAEREQLMLRRDALQLRIVQTAARMAQERRGEWRRTVPVITLADGLTVCSASVSCPRRGFRFAKRSLVTLTRSHDVLVRQE
jgi:hypothetical protein